MILEDLHKSISNMTDEELAETFRQVRLSRRQVKRDPSRKKKTTVSAKPKDVTLPTASSMSPDMAAELLKTLTGE